MATMLVQMGHHKAAILIDPQMRNMTFGIKGGEMDMTHDYAMGGEGRWAGTAICDLSTNDLVWIRDNLHKMRLQIKRAVCAELEFRTVHRRKSTGAAERMEWTAQAAEHGSRTKSEVESHLTGQTPSVSPKSGKSLRATFEKWAKAQRAKAHPNFGGSHEQFLWLTSVLDSLTTSMTEAGFLED